MRLMLALGVVTMAACSSTSEPPKPALTYPATTMGSVVDDYGGTKVADPYRWMEDVSTATEVADVGRRVRTRSPIAYLEHAAASRSAERAADRSCGTTRASGCRRSKAARCFYAKNAGLQRQAPIFTTQTRIDSRADARDRSERDVGGRHGLARAVRRRRPTRSCIAYGLSEGGADWETIHVRDLGTGKDLADEVRWMRFSGISWTRDSKDRVYSALCRAAEQEDAGGGTLAAVPAVLLGRVGTPKGAPSS